MPRYVEYHNDGSVRMDWYTFRALNIDKIMDTLRANRIVKPKHTIRPQSRNQGVKQFS